MVCHSRAYGINPSRLQAGTKVLLRLKPMKSYFVYILASKKNGTLYIGVTSDLIKRVWQHKNKISDGFTQSYDVDKLVYFEPTSDVLGAIAREKQLKKWNRAWKIGLIEEKNPQWKDLYNDIIG